MLLKLTLLLIVLLATFLRFTNLAINPPHLNWDEASLGYTAWTLLNYGADEYGNSWPFSIRSFNDYKPPLYSYLTVLPVALFGLNEFSTRFVSAFLGTLTTIVVFFLTKELFRDQNFKFQKTQAQNKFQISNPKNLNLGSLNLDFTLNLASLKLVALLSSLLFALSPWSLQFSRGAYEGNIAVFFTTLGMLFLLKFINQIQQEAKLLTINYSLLISTLSFTAALYSYHAARLVIPLVCLFVGIRYFKHFLRHWRTVILSSLIAVVLCIPLIVITLRGATGARLGAVSVLSPFNIPGHIFQRKFAEEHAGHPLRELIYSAPIQYIPLVLKGYFDHYSVHHMFIFGDVVNRHHAPGMGLLYLIELPFIIIGLYALAIRRFNGKFLFWSWWLIAPLPAALATGTPHAIRSILWLPLPQIATAVGIFMFIKFISSKLQTYQAQNKLKKPSSKHLAFANWNLLFPLSLWCLIFGILLFAANILYYLRQYHIHQPVEYAQDWQYGYKQLITEISPYYQDYDEVYITTAYDQPYIFFLFYEQYRLENGFNPGDFNRYYKNITFETIDIFRFREYARAHPDKKILVIGTPDEIFTGESQLAEIDFPDGQTAFKVIKFVQ